MSKIKSFREQQSKLRQSMYILFMPTAKLPNNEGYTTSQLHFDQLTFILRHHYDTRNNSPPASSTEREDNDTTHDMILQGITQR